MKKKMEEIIIIIIKIISSVLETVYMETKIIQINSHINLEVVFMEIIQNMKTLMNMEIIIIKMIIQVKVFMEIIIILIQIKLIHPLIIKLRLHLFTMVIQKFKNMMLMKMPIYYFILPWN